jgi:hypothetical protein
MNLSPGLNKFLRQACHISCKRVLLSFTFIHNFQELILQILIHFLYTFV